MFVDYKYELGDYVTRRSPAKVFQCFEMEFMVTARFILDTSEMGKVAYYHVVDKDGNVRSFYEFSLIGEGELLAEKLRDV